MGAPAIPPRWSATCHRKSQPGTPPPPPANGCSSGEHVPRRGWITCPDALRRLTACNGQTSRGSLPHPPTLGCLVTSQVQPGMGSDANEAGVTPHSGFPSPPPAIVCFSGMSASRRGRGGGGGPNQEPAGDRRAPTDECPARTSDPTVMAAYAWLHSKSQSILAN
jgi:hypothetical protein